MMWCFETSDAEFIGLFMLVVSIEHESVLFWISRTEVRWFVVWRSVLVVD